MSEKRSPVPPRGPGDFEFQTEEGRLVRLEYATASLSVYDTQTGSRLFSLGPAGVTVIFQLLMNWPKFPVITPIVEKTLEACGKMRLADTKKGPLPTHTNRQPEVEQATVSVPKGLPAPDEFESKKFDL